MALFQRGANPYMLVVGMTGVKMGDHLALVGCAHGGRLGAVAAKVGLSGRAVAIVPDEASAARARKGAAEAGVLVEIETAPASRLPLDPDAFNVVIVDNTGGLLGAMSDHDRKTTFQETHRVLRPGGRVMVIGASRQSGLAGLLTRVPEGATFDVTPLLQSGGFKSVRTLAEREGLVFVEAMKGRA